MGAWIETVHRKDLPLVFEVAPRVGAWIVPVSGSTAAQAASGRAPRACLSADRGAWIETWRLGPNRTMTAEEACATTRESINPAT